MHFVLQITVPNDCTELSVISESVKYANVWRSRSRGRYAKMREDPRADTAEFSWQAQKRDRYDGTYARYRDFVVSIFVSAVAYFTALNLMHQHGLSARCTFPNM
jgi:hypothetical protein